MNQEQIIELVREAGGMADYMTWVERDLLPVFERFAALVAAAEREKVEDLLKEYDMIDPAFARDFRARGETK